MALTFDDLERLEACAADAAHLLKVMANSQRLILLRHLAEGECSVNELAAYTGLSPSAASQHLARLRTDKLVATRREAQTVWYRLDDPRVPRLIAAICDTLGDAG